MTTEPKDHRLVFVKSGFIGDNRKDTAVAAGAGTENIDILTPGSTSLYCIYGIYVKCDTANFTWALYSQADAAGVIIAASEGTQPAGEWDRWIGEAYALGGSLVRIDVAVDAACSIDVRTAGAQLEYVD